MTSVPDRVRFPPLSYLMLQGLIVLGVDIGGSDRNDSTFYHLLVEVRSCHTWKPWIQLIEACLKKMCE